MIYLQLQENSEQIQKENLKQTGGLIKDKKDNRGIGNVAKTQEGWQEAF